MTKSKIIISLAVILGFLVVLFLLFFVQNQPYSKTDEDALLFKQEFGDITVLSQNLNFSPPVNMYQALRLALESDNWSSSSLENMTIKVSLNYCEFVNHSSDPQRYGFHNLYAVTKPINDYSPVQINSTTYRNIWMIYVDKTESLDFPHTKPIALYFVDSSTAELIDHGSLY